jgi:16S rRNA (adenine1518-N6/adenine1519-N6)-dimethyltransferase
VNLADRQELEPFIRRHGLAAAKSLGQHFLCSPRVVGAIVGACEGAGGILEIGPGPGILTGPLGGVAPVVALEVDPRMRPALAESAPSARVVLADALTADLQAFLAELAPLRVVVSNLPYYITGPLLTRIVEASGAFDRAVLMMQREVAEKVLAPAGARQRGSLTVYLEARFQVSLICHVPAGAFLPPPKVESTVLRLVARPRTLPPRFDWLIRVGNAQPRKTLVNNLLAAKVGDRERVETMLAGAGIDAKARPCDPTLEQWIVLAEQLA